MMNEDGWGLSGNEKGRRLNQSQHSAICTPYCSAAKLHEAALCSVPVTAIKVKEEKNISVYQATAQNEPHRNIYLRGWRPKACQGVGWQLQEHKQLSDALKSWQTTILPFLEQIDVPHFTVSTGLIQPLFMKWGWRLHRETSRTPQNSCSAALQAVTSPRICHRYLLFTSLTSSCFQPLAGRRARCVGPRGAEGSWTVQSAHLVQAVKPKSQAGRGAARNKSKQSSGCL